MNCLLTDVRLSFGAGKLYGDHDFLEERHRHRFEVRLLLWVLGSPVQPRHKRGWVLLLLVLQVNPELKKSFEEQGLKFVGQDEEGERMEIVELEGECVRG